ncbi:MAG: DUF3459 domain-containing protein, partial [Chitinophagaceae bacterium]
ADWKRLVDKAHALGLKVIIDWVPNHTGGDHYWLTKHPDFYVRDPKTGEAVSPFDWTDVRKLNYSNPRMVDSMIATLKWWIRETGIDGYRCDVAGEVPKAFWSRCIRELRAVKPVFMLAESNEPWMHTVGFNATYAWEPFSIMKDIAAGKRPASALDSLQAREDTAFVSNALRLYFTSNHDENSWNKADYGTMPGPVHAPFAVLTFTMKRSLPLVYSGQEEPVTDSLSFFWKDTVPFRKYARAPFYKQLTALRRNNPAMASDAQFTRLATGNDAALYAFERRKGNSKVLVILNLSAQPQQLTWKRQPSQNVWMNVFGGLPEPVKDGFGIEPWGYAVYERR